MAHYLVTGGCGFIGSHLCHKLIALGHQVSVIDNLSVGKKEALPKEAQLYVLDIIEFDGIAPLFKNIDACFHLAAIPSVAAPFEAWMSCHQTNLTGSLNVFRAALVYGQIPVVYASSCAVYGDEPTLPLCEDGPTHPISAYACDKLSTELNAHFLGHDYQFQSVGLRFFNVYGEGQNPTSPYSGVISRFIQACLTHQPMTIYGHGEQTRDFIYVHDIVCGLLFGLKKASAEAPIFNLCTGHATTILKLSDLVARIIGVPHQINYLAPRIYDVPYSIGSPLLAELSGFSPQYSLEEGLIQTIDYFKTLNSDKSHDTI